MLLFAGPRFEDPEWAAQRIADLEESTYPRQDSAATDRYVDIDKAWNGIWFLLNAVGAPVDVVAGGTPLSGEDLGYDAVILWLG